MSEKSRSRAEQMRQLMAEYETSGLSGKDFAAKAGITTSNFWYWRRRLRELDSEGSKPSVEGAPSFVAVRISPDSDDGIEFSLRLPNGVRVGVPRGFHEEDLRRVLKVASSC